MKTDHHCPSIAKLQMFLDESIAAAERQQVNEHVQTCRSCQATLESITSDASDVQTQSQGISATSERPHSLDDLMGHLRNQQPPIEHSEPPSIELHSSLDAPAEHWPDTNPDLAAYELGEELGRGTSGVVYRAVDKRLGRAVAIKVLRNDLGLTETARQRLEREARAAAALNHNNVVTLYQIAGELHQAPFLVMELVEGRSLHDLLDSQHLVAPPEAARIVGHLAEALAVAHDRGLIHRDIKPSNVLIEQSTGQPKLTDFGLALDMDLDAQLTREGTIAGTPAYISPEQILDPHNVDGRSDLYSLGVIMYQLLTGELPFRGVVRMTLMSVLHEEPRALRQLNDEVPLDLQTICLKALNKDPAQRYQTAQELSAELNRWKEGRPILARPASSLLKLRRWCGRNPKLAGLSLLTGLLLFVVAVGSTAATFTLSAARQEARISADAASTQRDLALKTLQKLVYDLNQELERDTVELDHVQAVLLQISLEGLRNVAKSAQDAGLTDLSTAKAHNGMGIVLIRLGQYDEAERHLKSAQRILNRLADSDPRDPDLLASRVESAWNLGELNSERNAFDPAVKQLQTALKLSQRLADQQGHDTASRLMLAQSYLRLAELQFQDPQTELIRHEFDPALDLFHELHEEEPDNIDITLDLMSCLNVFGGFCTMLGDFETADQHYTELVDTGLESLETFPGSFEISLPIYEAYESLGDVAILDDDFRRARKFFRRALRFAEQHSDTLLFAQEEVDRLEQRIAELDFP